MARRGARARPGRWIVLVPLALALTALPMRPQSPAVSVIVQGARSGAGAAEAVARAGGTVTVPLRIVDGVAARVPADRLDALRADRRVRAVTPNETVHVAETSSSTTANTVKSVFASEVGGDVMRQQGFDGRGVGVALIDTGVAPLADLAGRVRSVPDPVSPGKTAVCADLSGEGSCGDSYGHGTFIAGLIAGNGALSGGTFTGIAPKADLISVKIAGRDGSADVTKVLAAIQYVVSFKDQLNIKVLNLSLGTNSTISWRIDPLNLAVERAWNAGIAVVVSAGNRGPTAGTISKPGDDPLVITVGAVDDRETPAIDDDRLPFFSSRGPAFLGTADQLSKPDVVAPGGRVISLRDPGSYIEERAPGGFPNADYRRGSGTSMSAGIVSGVAALVLQAHPSWTPDRLKFALTASARKVAERSPAGIGAGLVDAYAASHAPSGTANGSVSTVSDGTGSLDGSRGDVFVSRPCSEYERVLDPMCDRLHGDSTAQGRSFDAKAYTEPWTTQSWYQSQWNGLLGSSWYGSSWYGCTTPSASVASCWYGSSWYGSSWYGSNDDTFYGTSVAGSSWYGAWQ